MKKTPHKTAAASDGGNIYTKRFYFLMRLVRINKMLRGAKIIPAEKQA
ncbi:MAG: hypothetical protein AB1458_12615 [Bacteroidota bacterium]